MKILHMIAGKSHGGAESFCARLLPALQKRGIKQTVITRQDTLPRDLQDYDIRVKNLPFGNPLIDFYTKYSSRNICNEFQPDIIMTWMNRASVFAPSATKIPILGRLGGYYNLSYYKNCDYLAGNTPDLVNYLNSQAKNKKGIFYLPNFAEIKKENPIERQQYGIPENAYLIFSLGRFHKNKAFDTLLYALEKIPNAYLLLGGDGDLKQSLVNQAKELSISKRVKFIGWVKNIASFYRCADLFVCPSRHEPLGNVVLEAMAYKIPIVTTDSAGPSHLIENGKSGLIVPVDNCKEMAKAINFMQNNPEKATEMAQNALKHYHENYSEEKICTEYISVFNSILQQYVS